jgi:hypothetical protein
MRGSLGREFPCVSRAREGIVVLAVCLGSGLARAAPKAAAPLAASNTGTPTRVLLLAGEAEDGLVTRIRAELADLGVTVITGRSLLPLDVAARERDAAIAVRVLPARNGVEIWMADVASGRSLLRQVIVDESRAGPNYSLIALQMAELLRTSLLYGQKARDSRQAPSAEKAQAEDAPASSAPSAHEANGSAKAKDAREAGKDARATASRSTRRGAGQTGDRSISGAERGAAAALGAFYSPGGAGVGVQLWLSFHWPLSRTLRLGVDASVPIESAKLSGPEGSAAIDSYLLGATLSARLHEVGQDWSLGAGLGAGVLRTSIEAKAAAPLEAVEDSVLSGVAYLRMDGAFSVTRWLRAGVRSVGGIAIPAIEVEFAGNRAGSFGRPFLGLFALTEIPWR